MSGPEAPGNPPPPEVPEEYLAAYTEAYRRALAQEAPLEPAEASRTADTHAAGDQPVRPDSLPAPAPDRPAREHGTRNGRPRPGWLPALLLALLALVLVLGAYGLGRLVSGSPEVPARKSPERPTPAGSSSTAPAGAWDGAVEPVEAEAARATCTARPGVDAAGNPVQYRAANTIDGDATTAWRCPGEAIGERLTIRLGSEAEVAEVGLIPGYAKTDASSGEDRYAENNRITRVRWTLADGVSVVQRLDPDSRKREAQLLRVPRTRTDRIVVEILAVERGPKNTTAISELVVSATDG